jgi:hypothetical protein
MPFHSEVRRVITGTLLATVLVAAVPVTAAAAVPANPQPGPAITTGPKNGEIDDILTESHGNWTNSPTSYAVQWRRCNDQNGSNCTDIAGATGHTYTIVKADRGFYMSVQVIASNADGPSAPASATLTQTVTGPPEFAPGSVPQIQGTAVPKQALTVTPAQVIPADTQSSFQFLRCDANGQNCSAPPYSTPTNGNPPSYQVTACDSGSTLLVQQVALYTSSTHAHQPISERSAPTAIVPAAPSWQAPCNGTLTVPTVQRDERFRPITDNAGMLVTGKLNGFAVTGKLVTDVYGYVEVGTTLTVQGHAKWDRADPARGYHYQWLSQAGSDKYLPIAGATDTTYTITANDFAKNIAIEERTFNDAGEGLLGAGFPGFKVVTDRPSDPASLPAALLAKLITRALKVLAAPTPKRKALLASGTYVYPEALSPGEGRMVVTWTGPAVAKAARSVKPAVFAKGTTATPMLNRGFRLKVKLTKLGKARLKAAKKTTSLTAKVTFTPKSGKASTLTKHFSIKR